MIKNNQKKYEEMKDKTTKTAIKLLSDLERWKEKLPELETKKDEVILSKTCIAHLDQRVKEHYYWRRKQLKTNAIQKWTECENEAVFVLNKALWTNYNKSKYAEWEKMQNERCTGHEDIDDKENKKTIDTKVCESFDTFPILTDDCDTAYEWQWLWYMWLKWEEYKEHIVAKVLVNSPIRQIKNKLYIAYMNLQKKYDGNEEYITEEYEQEAKEIFLNNVFDKQITVNSDWVLLQLSEDEIIPYEKRVKLFKFSRDEEKIEKIIKRVEECRLYLHQQWYKQW